jgi:hypothetical protein
MYKNLRNISCLLLLIPIISIGSLSCSYSKQQLTPEEIQQVRVSVTQFTSNMARDLSAKGPITWNDYIDDSPNFLYRIPYQKASPKSILLSVICALTLLPKT